MDAHPGCRDATDRVEVVAEIANAHDGDPERACELARQAVAAGADAVKFQVYTAEELLAVDHPRFGHFKEFEFPRDFWPAAVAAVQTAGCKAYCDVFGIEAFEIASEAGADGFKVHASDLRNQSLLDRLARTGAPVLVSAGGAGMRDLAVAVRLLRNGSGRVTLLHGFQAYPTAPEDAGLGRLQVLREVFGDMCDIGYMDHADAETLAAWTLPAMAVALGARVVEKHITLERRLKGTDYYSSLNPEEFRRFVDVIQQADVAVRQCAVTFSAAERAYSIDVVKCWVAARPLSKGAVLQSADLHMKRVPGSGFCADLDQLVGRPLLRDISRDEPVRAADVPQVVVAIVVARMASSRLPGKAMASIDGVPALAHLFQRLRLAESPTRIVLCTTTNVDDDVLADLARREDVAVVRGDTDNVLQRMIAACDQFAADVVLRVTGDDILVDPTYLDRSVRHHLETGAEYTSAKALPGGTEVEAFNAAVLRAIAALAIDPNGTEYLTLYVHNHADQFRCAVLPVPREHRQSYTLSLDTADDLEVLRALLLAMKTDGKAIDYSMDDIVAFMSERPELVHQSHQRPARDWLSTDLDWRRLL